MTECDTRQRVTQGHSFALYLTHVVDRVSKTYQGVFYALRNLSPLASILSLGLDAWVGSPGELYEHDTTTEAVDSTGHDVVR